MPNVSIIIPTHNRAALLPASVQSVLDQTYTDLEIIIIDDASSDDTPEVLRDLQQAHGSIIRPVRNDVNLGHAGSRNRGIALARGELIGFLDDDDLYAPSKIEKQVAVLDQHPEADVVYCGFYYLYENDVPKYPSVDLPEGDLLEDLLLACPILAHAPLIRRRCFEKWGVFDVTFRACEDWELWQRFAIHGCRFACVQEALCAYRRHSGNITHNLKALAESQFEVLDRTFAAPELPAHAMALKPVAYARSNIVIACALFDEGDFEGAGIYLRKVLPEAAKNDSVFSFLIASLAHSALASQIMDSQAFLEQVGTLIAPAGLSKRVCAHTRAVIEFELATEAYHAHDWRHVISHGLSALSHNFGGFARNRGLYAMLFKSLAGA